MRLMMILMLVATSALAAVPGTPDPIDSSASGVYLGSDRVCRVVLSRYEALWTQVDIRCQHFAGGQSASLTTVWGNCPQGGAYNLTPWAPGEYLSLRTFDATDQVLQIVRGADQIDVNNGLGTAEAWYVIGFAPSPSPYTCATSLPRIDPHAMARFCREYPTVPACRG